MYPTSSQLYRAVVALLLLFSTSLSAGSGVARTFEGRVVGVADGDTITVLEVKGKKKTARKIRLWGIDCPEKRQDFGQKAKKFAANLVFDKIVTVKVKTKDRYGRLVASVEVEGVDLSLALVEQGLAWWYVRYAKKAKNLEAAELRARKAKKGLWSRDDAVEPWKWRRSKKKKACKKRVKKSAR